MEYQRTTFILFICLIVLISCSAPEVQPTETSQIARSQTATPPRFVTNTPPQVTLVPTNTVQVRTPRPTLDLNLSLEDKLITIAETNGYCDFPCFWGLAPRETSHRSVLIQLERIGMNYKVEGQKILASITYSSIFQSN